MRTHTRMRFSRELLGLLAACSIFGQQSQFQGSVAVGTASPTRLPLTLHDAIDRGLKANLGLLVSDSTSESVRGQRLQALSALLPQIHAQGGETVEQVSLKTLGFNFSFPGVSIPTILGPFHYTDVRAYASWNAFDYNARKTFRSAEENKRAAQLSVADARELVGQ